MRIASFNVDNLFRRVRAMNLASWQEGKPILDDYSTLNNLLQKPEYSDADKKEIAQAVKRLGLTKSDESEFVLLRQNRGRLLKRSKIGLQVVAAGRGDWIGWLELKTETVSEIATRMIAKVVQELNADILAVVEAENRTALCRFNEQLLKPLAAEFGPVMLIDGNDDRGIDVGLLTKPGKSIERVVSHIDDADAQGGRLFSRDCPEYTVRLNEGTTILLMVNHLKSKGYGTPASSDARRREQAQRVREIYEQRRSEGVQHIAILGDFNDTPDSAPLQPLLGEDSDLKDIFVHPLFQSDGRPGTFGNGTKSEKLDYMLLSPALFDCVTAGGVLRKGVWGGSKGTLFPHYPEMTKMIHAASDHAAVWADISI